MNTCQLRRIRKRVYYNDDVSPSTLTPNYYAYLKRNLNVLNETRNTDGIFLRVRISSYLFPFTFVLPPCPSPPLATVVLQTRVNDGTRDVHTATESAERTSHQRTDRPIGENDDADPPVAVRLAAVGGDGARVDARTRPDVPGTGYRRFVFFSILRV